MIAIAEVGLCTAQGGTTDVVCAGPLEVARPLPWPPSARTTCPIGFAAHAIDPALRGLERWRALAQAALAELEPRRELPIVIGSCNGAADERDAHGWATAFAGLGDAPIASAACASGLHALWLGVTKLLGGSDEVIVLAVDTLSRASCDHFELLRVLSPEPRPWQPTAAGFVPGEAAVAIRLVRARDGDRLPRLIGPVLAHDRDDADALAQVAGSVACRQSAFAVGQGTGPVAVDARELASIHAAVGRHAPLATALEHFGHTVGASGLLSVALATLARHHRVRGLALPDGATGGNALVACRALGGACAAIAITGEDIARGTRAPAWGAPSAIPPLRMPLLRRIVAELPARPATPPGAVIVRVDAPLVPPADAMIGDRMLPSVVLEMTPGFIPQLVARAWGYGGPALCLVGGTDDAWLPTLAACRRVHGSALVLHVHGHDFDWEA